MWHALPYTTHTEAAGLEEFIRGLHYAQQLSAMFGKKYISAKMTDVPGHTSMLPSLLAKAGINVLTVNQNIPVGGEASVSLSVHTGQMKHPVESVARRLLAIDGVVRVQFLG